MTDPDPRAQESLDRAMEEHRRRVGEVLQNGSPDQIKGLYVELGDLLEHALETDPAAAPVLSLPETGPVVLGLLDGVDGLLLDAGCGPNPAMSVALARAQNARTMVGMDIGFGIVRLARAVAERQGIRFLPIVADLEALPFRNGVFDGGVCDDTIEHLPDDRRGIDELARVLKHSGRMVIATPNRESAEVLFRKGRDRIKGRRNPASAYYAATSHLREYTWLQAERLLESAFRIRKRASVGWAEGGWKRKLATRATETGLLRRFSRMIVIEVEPKR